MPGASRSSTRRHSTNYRASPSKSMATKSMALVVGDDPATRALETDVLEEGGFSVVQARNGEEALRLAQERRPRVVLLDIALPTASGFDVLRSLRSRPATSEVPVVLISAYAGLVDDCKQRANACVQKPFEIDALLAEVRGALQPNVNG
jgi:DNA-binding response OmpR family regulator